MSKAIPINGNSSGYNRGRVGSVTASPNSPVALHSPVAGFASGGLGGTRPKSLTPFNVGELRLLLLENISEEAVEAFRTSGFQVDHFAKSWSEDELVAKIGPYHAIGIRSKTKITERILRAANNVSVSIPGLVF